MTTSRSGASRNSRAVMINFYATEYVVKGLRMPFTFKRLAIPELVLVTPRVFQDGRGFFMETYKFSEFQSSGISDDFVQDNYSSSSKGVLRGLHYQIDPMAQGKLVRCIHGAIFDVAVDIRNDSPTYGRWVSCELSSENKQMLYIPTGFAHGFAVLSDQAEIVYKCTREYSPAHERGIIWNDPSLGIPWPVEDPILAEKDKDYPCLKMKV